LVKNDLVVLLNSDTVVEDDSLQRCAAWMRLHPRVGALSPRLIGIDEKPQQCLFSFPTFADLFLVSLRRRSKPPEQSAVSDGWLAGTALFLRREALQQIGGELDAGYFMYWEDVDLSARLKKRGWERVVFPGAYVRHYGGASGGAADSPLRSDLFAWYAFGRHRWFSRHRPAFETVGLWLLEALEVPRLLLRGWRSHRVHVEWAHIRTLLKVLLWQLRGQTPPRPGTARAS
jgi:GT2 family glycosyltransferase